MIAIKTRTQEEFNRVLEIFEGKGWTWKYWDIPTKLKYIWNSLNKETCIDYNDKFLHSNLESYKREWYEIISFDEFLKKEGIKDIKGKIIQITATSCASWWSQMTELFALCDDWTVWRKEGMDWRWIEVKKTYKEIN